MKDYKKNIHKKWEISVCEFFHNNIKLYKVTRHLPEMSVSETKVFESKEKALQQFNEWLA